MKKIHCSYVLQQPPKNNLRQKTTHCLFSIAKDQANRLDLVFNRAGELTDYYFCSVENGRRVPVDPETEKAVKIIISAIKTGESILRFAKDFIANPSWVGGEILLDVCPQEFEFDTLDWPEKIAEKIMPKSVRLIYFGTGIRTEVITVHLDENRGICFYLSVEPERQEKPSDDDIFYAKAVTFAAQKVIESGQNVWSWFKDGVDKINKNLDGHFPFFVSEEERVIIFQKENWMAILATNLLPGQE